jgi:hypothetical protein
VSCSSLFSILLAAWVFLASATGALATQTHAHRSITVAYDPALLAKGFPSPVVRARISGTDVLFLIDTGAGVHTLASWLVNVANLETTATAARVTGSTGADVPVRVVNDVDLQLSDGPPLSLHEAVVTDFPPLFQSLRIGGLISPQLLATPGEAVVIDFRIPTLVIESEDASDHDLGSPSRVHGKACRNPDSAFENRLYSVGVKFDGKKAAVLVDSGATSTVIGEHSHAASAMAGRPGEASHSQGVGGDVEIVRRIPDVVTQAGGARFVMNVKIGRVKNSCGDDGLLGMDALRACSVVLHHEHLTIGCRP